jgi:hypothetical protein
VAHYTTTLLIIDHGDIFLQKKKLSDLGSQWSKDELEHFYGAYRKYGKDWRKVWFLPSLLCTGVTFTIQLKICSLGNHIVHQHDYPIISSSSITACQTQLAIGFLYCVVHCSGYMLFSVLLNIYGLYTINLGNPSDQYMRI